MTTLIQFIEAVPAIKDWVEKLIALYVATRIASMKQENREAIKKALIEHNQIPLEQAIGNPHAGEPSGVPGSVIVDSIEL